MANFKEQNTKKSSTESELLIEKELSKSEAVLRRRSQEVTETVASTSNTVKESLHIVESLGQLIHKVGVVVERAGKVLPPLRVAAVAVGSLLDIGRSIFLEKGKVPSRAARIGLSVAAIAAVAVGVAVPIVGGAMLVLGVAIGVVKEGVNLVEGVREYLRNRRQLKSLERELADAKRRGDTNEIKELNHKIADKEHELKHTRDEVIEKSIDLGWGVMAVVGAALSVTPFFAVGWALLGVSALGGIATKIGAWVKKKIDAVKAQKHSVEQHAEHEVISKHADKVGPHPELDHEHTHNHLISEEQGKQLGSTAKMSLEMAHGKLKLQEEHHDHAHGEYSDEEIKAAIKDLSETVEVLDKTIGDIESLPLEEHSANDSEEFSELQGDTLETVEDVKEALLKKYGESSSEKELDDDVLSNEKNSDDEEENGTEGMSLKE